MLVGRAGGRLGRVGRPGLLGTMARTAVVAGTATAVADGVARHQARRDEEAAAAEPAGPAQEAALNPQPLPPMPAPVAETGGMAQLETLVGMRRDGLLTDEEFAAAKSRLLGL